MESDGDHFLAYYLTEDDESAITFKSERFQQAPYQASEDQKASSKLPPKVLYTLAHTFPPQLQPTAFHFVRDYETVKVEHDVLNEFLLVFDDGISDQDTMAADTSHRTAQRRGRGAYYKNIERKMLLKKKRVNVSPPSKH
jgi:RNA polymerase II-associated factor 1